MATTPDATSTEPERAEPVLSMSDDIELSVLAETGDIELAERVGFALRYTFQALADLTGVDINSLEFESAS